MNKIDRINKELELIKTAGIGKEIMQHKNESWFYPVAGGVAGSLLASPEIIKDIRSDNTPQALRRLILSAGIGTGLGYAGGKILQGDARDLKKIIDAVKEKTSQTKEALQ